MSIDSLTAQVILAIDKPEFIQSILLLFLTALLTGLLVPWINAQLTHRKFKQQVVFEADLSKQHKVIEAQSDTLEELERIIWNHYLRALAVAWYKCRPKDQTKGAATFEKYDEEAWEFYGAMQQALGKASRLVAAHILRELKVLYRSLMEMDAHLVELMEKESGAIEWQALLKDIQIRHAGEIEKVMSMVAADLGLLGHTATSPDTALADSSEEVRDLLPRIKVMEAGNQSDAAADQAVAGNRRAVCIGINDYMTSPLRGAAEDAITWSDVFIRCGFAHCITLLNADATRASILDSLLMTIQQSMAGDVVVFQFSGLGTSLPIPSGESGSDGRLFQALLPCDYVEGNCISIEEIYKILSDAPIGVSATCFFDCCFSGTITRFGVGLSNSAHRPDKRSRFLYPNRELSEKFSQLAAELPFGSVEEQTYLEKNTIAFFACESNEVAFELNGRGVFSVEAAQIVTRNLNGLTNEQFVENVNAAFGPSSHQHAALLCSDEYKSQKFLRPFKNFESGASL